jgi:hypothetical protein
MTEEGESPPFGWFFGGVAFLVLGVAAVLFGVLGASCFLGSFVFYGLSCIGGWVFLAIGLLLLLVGAAMMVAFRSEI